MESARILIVEDEEKISSIVKSYLEREGYAAEAVASGEAALSALSAGYDLVILDLKLPGIDGETVCRAIREVSDIPVIMLTARSAEDERVRGLGLGADDYVVKPFSTKELVARVKAHLRRSKKDAQKELSFNRGALIIEPGSREVIKNSKRISLTATEFGILLSMAERPNMVFSRLQLTSIVQGFDFDGFDRVVDAHIKNLRQKIEDEPQKPGFIRTVYGMGYKFTGEPDK